MSTSPVIPIPRHVVTGGGLRALRDGVLRVHAEQSSAIDAASAVSAIAFELPIIAVTDADADVVVRITEVPSASAGVDPRPADRRGASEAYTVRTDGEALTLVAGSAEAAFRGLLTIAGAVADGELPALTIDDDPDHHWRGLSLDIARRWFPVDEVEKIIDLLAVHRMTVLHLHLTDSQAWRFAVPGYPGVADDESYSLDDLTRLEEYARSRFVTIVPELDVPGHVAESLVAIDGIEVAVGDHPFVRYLTWEGEGVAAFIRKAFAVLAERFGSPYLHLGGDEAFGAPHDGYVRFVREAADLIRSLGRTPIGWQEAVRADTLGPDDLVQLWIAERDLFDLDKARATFPEKYHAVLEQAAELFALSVDDAARIGAAGVPTIVSSSDPLYLDRRTTDASTDPAQADVWSRLGHAGYDATPTTSVLDWDPATQPDIVDAGLRVAGIEAALWCESVDDFDDVAVLLLPRLALVAQRAWGGEQDREAVIAAAAAQAAVWTRLGFPSFYRSVEVFDA